MKKNHDCLHNHISDTSLLVRRENSDIRHFEKTPSITDYASDTDGVCAGVNDYREKTIC